VAGLHVVGDGGIAHVYAQAIAPGDRDAGRAGAALGWAAAVAWRTPGVAEVLARLPVPGVPGLTSTHPDWGLDHERAGDLLVVAGPGYQFVDGGHGFGGLMVGNHGGPREARVPLVIVGGALGEIDAPSSPPSCADVGATIRALVDLPLPRRFDGGRVHEGHAMALRLR
jgi:hypothetical protein